MSKRHRWSAFRCWVVLGLAVVGIWGCDGYLGDPDAGETRIGSEKTRRIDTLQLQRAEPNAVVRPPEVNAVPPARMEVSLEECRSLALVNNLQLKASLIAPTIAEESIRQEEAKFEPRFLPGLTLSKSNSQPISQYSEIYGTTTDSISPKLGVEMPLRTGGTISFDATDSRTSSNSPGVLADPYYGAGASLSVSQPLLRNAGVRLNAYSIRIADYEAQNVDAQTKLEVITVLAAIDRVYWRLYAARRELEVRRQQHDLAEAQLDKVRRLVNAGQRAEPEVVRAEAGVAQQLEAIIVAENNLRDRERELKRVINRAGIDMQSETIMVPTTEPAVVRYDLDRPQLVRTAMSARMELLELQLQILEDAEKVDYARNQALPLVTVDYTYNVSGRGATRSDAYDLLVDNTYNDKRLGLQAVIPIGNETAKSRVRQALYQKQQRLATRKNREVTIEQEVLNAADLVETDWQRILAARQNTMLQSRLYEVEKRQFDLGMQTSTDVLDAQISFSNAQSAEINALAEYQIALVDLAYATGTILGADRIEWGPIVPVVGDH
jgi:outer membrane protein